MTSTPSSFPVRFVIFTGANRGKVVGTTWHKFASDWIDHAETDAGRMAREWGAEVDIETGSVFPSGKVAGWERAGIRVAA